MVPVTEKTVAADTIDDAKRAEAIICDHLAIYVGGARVRRGGFSKTISQPQKKILKSTRCSVICFP